jgi:hypothetical protein
LFQCVQRVTTFDPSAFFRRRLARVSFGHSCSPRLCWRFSHDSLPLMHGQCRLRNPSRHAKK